MAEKIVISKEEEVLTVGSDHVCKLCVDKMARYTCPRCALPYCSLDCYRGDKHRQCSEGFYRDCFTAELKQMKGDEDDKKKMMEMLQRLEKENEEVDDVEDIESRFSELDLNQHPDKVWESLTAEEQNEFMNLVNTNKIEKLIEIWQPWWHGKLDQHRVEFLGDDTLSLQHPPIKETTADIRKFVRKQKFSEQITFDIIGVLYAYSYVARLHNGCHQELCENAVEEILQISDVLNENKSFESCLSAIHKCQENVISSSLFTSQEFMPELLVDVKRMVLGPAEKDMRFVLAALSDLHKLFTRSRKLGKADKTLETVSSSRKLFCIMKKLEYLIAWTSVHGAYRIPWCATVLIREHEKLQAFAQEKYNFEKLRQERNTSSKKTSNTRLISEIE